ncbi:MAG: hypothetical protein HY341_00100 [Candidatus Kerfeldbacteria bacterium]|nr:hypothetical protein [Candidatus Kerfeldbacteria bacterium]
MRTNLILLGGAMVLYANIPFRKKKSRRKKKHRNVFPYGPFEFVVLVCGLGLLLYGVFLE